MDETPYMEGLPYDNSPMRTYGTSIEKLTDLSNELYELELKLRGMVLDEKGNATRATDPVMNDLGIYRVISLLSTVATRNTNFSNIPEKRVNDLMLNLGDTMIRNLMINWKNWGMNHQTRHTDRDMIMAEINNICEFCIRRGVAEGEKRFWKGSQQDNRTEIVNGQQKKSFLGMKWGG